MSAVEHLRKYVFERLTAAAEEIFGVFEKTIVEQEEEIDRQRRLLNIVWKPKVKLHRIELPQQDVCTQEEVLADQHLCNQERNFSLDQEDPEPPQFKEKQEELWTSQEGEQLVMLLKQETDTLMLTPAHEGSDHQTLYCNPDQSQSEAETQTPASICISLLQNKSDCEHPEVSESKSAHQLSFHSSQVAESTDHKGDKHGDSVSTRNAKPLKTRHKSNSHTNDVHNPNLSKPQSNTHTGDMSLKCDTCGKTYMQKSQLQRHLRVHTGERPFSCSTCGKGFIFMSELKRHLRVHSGEKPYSCKVCGNQYKSLLGFYYHMKYHPGVKPFTCETCGREFRSCREMELHKKRAHPTVKLQHQCSTCGKSFDYVHKLNIHLRTHTGEKPFPCNTCGKRFITNSELRKHIKIHTGEKPFPCNTCGKRFITNSELTKHIKIHTGEKPYSCNTCGKRFLRNSALTKHKKTHTGEKPYSCSTCGKRLTTNAGLKRHIRLHTGEKP